LEEGHETASGFFISCFELPYYASSFWGFMQNKQMILFPLKVAIFSFGCVWGLSVGATASFWEFVSSSPVLVELESCIQVDDDKNQTLLSPKL
jgi:hypothetical protein